MSKHKKFKPSISDKAFAAWLKLDPLVNLIITRGEEEVRRDIMLHFLGPKATKHYFKHLPKSKHDTGPVLPQTVREQENNFVDFPEKRTKIIKTLVHWAIDPHINSRYVSSHRTRIQIVSSFLTAMFLHANNQHSRLILSGIKKIAFQKKNSAGKTGDQSPSVQQSILNRVIEILIQNQKSIIAKAVGEIEEKMRAELLRSIQTLKGDKVATPYYESSIVQKKPLIQEKFPLPRSLSQELEMILKGYTHSPWEKFRDQAKSAQKELERLRYPLGVDT